MVRRGEKIKDIWRNDNGFALLDIDDRKGTDGAVVKHQPRDIAHL
jgi:hypothetical protein